MKDGRMVATTERLANLRERRIRQLSGEMDRDLPWPRHASRSACRDQLRDRQLVVAGDHRLDLVNRERSRRWLQVHAVEHRRGELHVDRMLAEGVVGHDPDERPLEQPNVVGDPLRDQLEYGWILELNAVERGPLPEDRYARREV